MNITVTLVDDHTLVREAIARMLDAQDGVEVTRQGGCVKDGMRLLAERDPRAGTHEVLVTDVAMPDGSGLALVRTARAANPNLGIVVLTMYGDDETLLEALESGATALVRKSAHAEEVVSAVVNAATNPASFSATGLADALRRRGAKQSSQLTPRETEVLQLLADGASVAEVGKTLYMSGSTVKTHISKIYDKLGAHNRASAVMAAVRLGLVGSRTLTPQP